jgi:metal-dependent amidase/aminoacylase/carboxypeptidase family protein
MGICRAGSPEFESAALLYDALEKAGFKVTRGVWTCHAFVAEYKREA